MRNRILSLILSFTLVATLLLSMSSPIIASAEGETVIISSAEDFVSFAKNCSYDLWSVGKTFFLAKSIDLTGYEFDGVPVFSGTFRGNGHTISGYALSGANSPAALFAILTKDGVIENLTACGAVAPAGDSDTVGGVVGENYGRIENVSFIGSVVGSSNVGGIAGVNKLSGSISDCLVAGEIIGDSAVGGIAGRNEGLISSSTSSAKVNNISVSSSLSLDDINISLTIDITKLPALGGNVSDIGGITGYSTGIVIGCTNNGRIGYPHIGYNIGGIAGRSSGHISSCVNNAEVYGRKDVGGIVGQMEPYVDYKLSEDILASLEAEFDRLNSELDSALGSVGSGSSGVSSKIDSLITNLEGATDSLNTLLGDLGKYGTDMTDEVNRMGVILKETLTQLGEVTSELPELADILANGLTDIEAALVNLDELAIIGVFTLAEVGELIEDASFVTESVGSALNNLADAIELFEGAIIVNDQAKAEKALGDVTDGLFAIIEAVDGFAENLESTIDALGDNLWMTSLIESAEKMVGELSDISSSITTLYNSIITIKDNLHINWEEIQLAGDEIILALHSFTVAIGDMDDALTLMESGLDKMTEGMDGIVNAVSVSDPEAVRLSAEKALSGIEDLVNAMAKGSAAISQFADSLRGLSEGGNLSDVLDEIVQAMDDLAGSGTESATAFTQITENLKILFDNIEIDFDAVTGGGELVFGGVKDMTAALRKMRSAIKNMRGGMDAINNAVGALSRAVTANDQSKIDEALSDISSSIDAIVYSTEDITAILAEAVDIMREAKIWSDNIIDSLSNLVSSTREITTAMLGLKDGIDELDSSIDFDLNSMKGGIEKTATAIRDMANAMDHAKNAFVDLSDVILFAKDASLKLSDLAGNLSNGVSKFAKAFNSIGNLTENLNKLISYLANVDAIQLPTPPESLTDEANKLFIYISNMESDLKHLNSDVSSMSDELIAIMGDINNTISAISDKVAEIIYGLENDDILDNEVSESEIDSITNGKIFSSINNGRVEGDLNVGGISGAMGLEYTLDPEDDLSPELSVTQKKQYRMKAVIHASKNLGDVVAKYDAAGGITGKMDFGLIYLSESLGNVESTSGSYVGGIAGIAAGRISSCFAKCSLAGNKYVGGIVGCGVSESFAGDSSIVFNCYTMVEVTRATQYFGAISGANIGEYKENYFISDDLAAIDKVSYGGKAEPIEYEELIKRRYIPDSFYGFTLKFVADGVVLHTVTFNYGDSISSTEYPEIPTKDGHYGVWDITELNNLTFDTTVSVIYTPYVITIAGGNRDGSDRHVFLVEGEFTEEDSLTAGLTTLTDIPTLKSGFFTEDSLVEGWVLTIPKDQMDVNRVHFLPTTNNARIFLKIDGVWQEAETTEFGSYLTFDVSGETVEIAVVNHGIKLLPIIILSSVALVVVATTVVVTVVKKKKNKE